MSHQVKGWEIFGDYARRYVDGEPIEVGFDENGLYCDSEDLPWDAIHHAAKLAIMGWRVTTLTHSDTNTEVCFTAEGIELWALGVTLRRDVILPWAVINVMKMETA